MATNWNKSARHKMARMGAAALSFLFLLSPALTAMANVENEETEAIQPEYEESVVREDAEESGQSPFSIPGNAELLDDAKNDDTKEFLTVQTKNNQTFFVVIDRAASASNVYMLSMIDEDDLAEFIEEDGGEKMGLNLPEKQEKTEEELLAEEEAAKEREAMLEQQRKQSGLLHTVMYGVGFILILIAVCGLYYYLKFYKPRKDEENAGSENLEDLDDFWGESVEINEMDEEPRSGGSESRNGDAVESAEDYGYDKEMEDEDE